MNKKTIAFLEFLNFNMETIELLKTSYSEIFYTNPDIVINNILTLVKYGYPKSDVEDFMLQNPTFVLYDNLVLSSLLENLGDDIESKLKSNPYFI